MFIHNLYALFLGLVDLGEGLFLLAISFPITDHVRDTMRFKINRIALEQRGKTGWRVS